MTAHEDQEAREELSRASFMIDLIRGMSHKVDDLSQAWKNYRLALRRAKQLGIIPRKE